MLEQLERRGTLRGRAGRSIVLRSGQQRVRSAAADEERLESAVLGGVGDLLAKLVQIAGAPLVRAVGAQECQQVDLGL